MIKTDKTNCHYNALSNTKKKTQKQPLVVWTTPFSSSFFFGMILDSPLRVIPSSKVFSISAWWKLCIKGSESPPESPQALSDFTVGQPWALVDLSGTHVKVYETVSVDIKTGPVFLAKPCSVKPIYMPKMKKNTAKLGLVSTPLLDSCCTPTHSYPFLLFSCFLEHQSNQPLSFHSSWSWALLSIDIFWIDSCCAAAFKPSGLEVLSWSTHNPWAVLL